MQLMRLRLLVFLRQCSFNKLSELNTNTNKSIWDRVISISTLGLYEESLVECIPRNVSAFVHRMLMYKKFPVTEIR